MARTPEYETPAHQRTREAREEREEEAREEAREEREAAREAARHHGATGATGTAKSPKEAKSPKDAATTELYDAAKELLTLMDAAGVVDLWRNDLKIGAAMGRLAHALVAVEAVEPPTVVTAPYAEQSADLLTCTMGTWTGEPTAYAYQWQRDGVDIPAGSSAQYTVTPADVGHSCTCIVTATNAAGSASSTSNAVVVTNGGATGAAGATGATGDTGAAGATGATGAAMVGAHREAR